MNLVELNKLLNTPQKEVFVRPIKDSSNMNTLLIAGIAFIVTLYVVHTIKENQRVNQHLPSENGGK